jgi:hypothetical protein
MARFMKPGWRGMGNLAAAAALVAVIVCAWTRRLPMIAIADTATRIREHTAERINDEIAWATEQRLIPTLPCTGWTNWMPSGTPSGCWRSTRQR